VGGWEKERVESVQLANNGDALGREGDIRKNHYVDSSSQEREREGG